MVEHRPFHVSDALKLIDRICEHHGQFGCNSTGGGMGWFSKDKNSASQEDHRKAEAARYVLAQGEAAEKVINDYGGVMGITNKMSFGAPESLLPWPKEEIKRAIKTYLAYGTYTKTLDEKFFYALEAGFASLSSFMSESDARNAVACQAAFNYAHTADTNEDAAEIAERLSSSAVRAAIERHAQVLAEHEALLREFHAAAREIGIPFAKTSEQIDEISRQARNAAAAVKSSG
jgi:hypothetical protein